ncbi:two-component system response regulator [Pedobacter sp. PACM 27299]|uniref:response regulator transcription factor n=1 Tax=Pedobacter sp. PACM 27299 TaxID=1727164 RepID=UPI000705B460|nr:response regulator transcription factor [Pedobacter sp. PACM 27299]ALL06144.1 two-component system response regulator [Pedobacter sp. PACM 27299]
MKILLIEDEIAVVSLIKRSLMDENVDLDISVAMDGLTGLKMAGMNQFDLIILDVMLPGMDGLEVCRNIRLTDPDVPIIILSALNQTEDIVAAFNLDADEYLTKPFKIDELKARVFRKSRKTGTVRTTPANLLTISDLVLDKDSKSVTRAGKVIVLTATEHRLLEYLMQHMNRIITRVDILEEVWGMNFNLSTNVVDVYLNYLRKKIDKNFSPKLIHTVIGMGYVLRVQENHED